MAYPLKAPNVLSVVTQGLNVDKSNIANNSNSDVSWLCRNQIFKTINY